MSTIEQTLLRLQQSAFRAKFHLSEKDRQYIMGKGMETIQHHAADFIRMRLAPAIIPNDGKQTPMRGHPVFIAQHACACCCRSCLSSEEGIKQEEKNVCHHSGTRCLLSWRQDCGG